MFLSRQLEKILQNPLIKPCKHKPQVTLTQVPSVHTLYLYDTFLHFTSITWCESSKFADVIQLHVQLKPFFFTHKIPLYKISVSKNHLSISSYQQEESLENSFCLDLNQMFSCFLPVFVVSPCNWCTFLNRLSV